MAINDQANDRYNPASNLSVDFEEYYFEDLPVNELFWQTNRPTESNPWRKENETQAMDVKTRIMHDIGQNIKVYILI